MKSGLILALFFSFMLLGIMLNSFVVIAQEGSGSSGSSNSDSESSSDSSTEVKTETRTDNSGSGKSDDDNGDEKVRTETRTKERDGKVEREFRTEIRNAAGEKIKIERKIKIKDGEVEIKTKLKIEGDGANLSVVDSKGEKHKVRVTPEKLEMLMVEKLGANNITGLSLDEIEHKNIPRVVFKVNSEHPGQFLGIFKLSIKAETQVDSETGEIVNVNVPWWAFLVTGEEISNIDRIVGNESLESEIVAGDDELEEEFGDIEVDEELEINVKTLNGSAEIKIELEFETQTTNTGNVVSEILSKLTLSAEEIDSLLEMGESDEPLEDKDKLKVKIEGGNDEDGLTEAKFELRFMIDSDSRESIVDEISKRLSELTTEEISNSLKIEDEENDFDELEDEEDEDENGDEEEDGDEEAIVVGNNSTQ